MLTARYATCRSMKPTGKTPPRTVTCSQNRCFVCLRRMQTDGHSNRRCDFLRISELHGRSGALLSSYVYSVSQADTPCIQRQADFAPVGFNVTFHRSFTMIKCGA